MQTFYQLTNRAGNPHWQADAPFDDRVEPINPSRVCVNRKLSGDWV